MLYLAKFQVDMVAQVVGKPEGEDRPRSARKWLKGIRIEGSGAVFNIQGRHPFQIVNHGRGRKSFCAPGFQIVVDTLGALIKNFF